MHQKEIMLETDSSGLTKKEENTTALSYLLVQGVRVGELKRVGGLAEKFAEFEKGRNSPEGGRR